jgi:hypothetical protein
MILSRHDSVFLPNLLPPNPCSSVFIRGFNSCHFVKFVSFSFLSASLRLSPYSALFMPR